MISNTLLLFPDRTITSTRSSFLSYLSITDPRALQAWAINHQEKAYNVPEKQMLSS